MIAIREESRLVESGLLSRSDNPLRNAPHTAEMLLTEQWEHPYTREQAAFPLPWVRVRKPRSTGRRCGASITSMATAT